MSYSGGMSQYAQDQQERENESGMDDAEYYYYEQERIRHIAGTVQPDSCKPSSRIDEKPF